MQHVLNRYVRTTQPTLAQLPGSRRARAFRVMRSSCATNRNEFNYVNYERFVVDAQHTHCVHLQWRAENETRVFNIIWTLVNFTTTSLSEPLICDNNNMR